MDKLSYHRHRYPSIVIQHGHLALFPLRSCYRDVEDMLAEPGIDVSYNGSAVGLRSSAPSLPAS